MSTGAEYESEDPNEMLVTDAEALFAMTDEDIAFAAGKLEWTEDEYRSWRKRKVIDYQSVDPHSLTAEQHQRLFSRDLSTL